MLRQQGDVAVTWIFGMTESKAVNAFSLNLLVAKLHFHLPWLNLLNRILFRNLRDRHHFKTVVLSANIYPVILKILKSHDEGTKYYLLVDMIHSIYISWVPTMCLELGNASYFLLILLSLFSSLLKNVQKNCKRIWLVESRLMKFWYNY